MARAHRCAAGDRRNVHLVGTPEQIVKWFARLRDSGRHAARVNFIGYPPDPEFFGSEGGAPDARGRAAGGERYVFRPKPDPDEPTSCSSTMPAHP
jgi:hypothetical protein